MLTRKSNEPEVLPGVVPEQDCQTTESVNPLKDVNNVEVEEEDHHVTWGGVPGGKTGGDADTAVWRTLRHNWSIWLERIALAMERPVNRLTGTAQLNPFYHTGPIATFLLVMVGLTGLYLFLFFQYGYTESYQAIARMEGQLIARVMRAIHRYASGALVLTTLLHAYRTLFMERFRGPRWLAWVTGVVMTVLVWGAGVTGYWMIWDERAQAITNQFVGFLQQSTSLAPALMSYMREVEGTPRSWPILLALLGAHVLLFVVTAVFFWLHIKRLNRPKWIPDVQWWTGMGLVLLLVSLVFPAGMLAQADPTRLPDAIRLDPIFLFFLPFAGSSVSVFLWVGLLLITAALTALPWLSKAKRPLPVTPTSSTPASIPVAMLPTVQILHDRCTGCTKCALDCPYGAIQMVERQGGKHKYIAQADPNLCVSCGICVGSCDAVAVTLGNVPPEMLWDTVAFRLAMAQAKAPAQGVKVLFTCERHASHGARPFLPGSVQQGQAVEIIPVPCVGTIPPDLMGRILQAGAAEVQIVGCPPDDCANREGNLWTEQRIIRQRVPRLRKAYADAPVTALWLSPDNFAQAMQLTPDVPTDQRLEQRRMMLPFTVKNLTVAFVLLAVVMVVQVLTTNLPFRAYPDRPAVAQVIVTDVALPFERFVAETAVTGPIAVQLEINDEIRFAETRSVAELSTLEAPPIYSQSELVPGTYHLRLTFTDTASGSLFTLFDRNVTITPGQVFRFGYDAGHTSTCWGDTCLKQTVGITKPR